MCNFATKIAIVKYIFVEAMTGGRQVNNDDVVFQERGARLFLRGSDYS